MIHSSKSASDRSGGERKRRVWRITESAPAGEFIDPDQVVSSRASASEPSQPGWATSSFELMNGVEISEDPETVPAELFDTIFKRA